MIVLYEIDDDDKCQADGKWTTDADHRHGAKGTQTEDNERKKEEHANQVENAEPTVGGGNVAK